MQNLKRFVFGLLLVCTASFCLGFGAASFVPAQEHTINIGDENTTSDTQKITATVRGTENRHEKTM